MREEGNLAVESYEYHGCGCGDGGCLLREELELRPVDC